MDGRGGHGYSLDELRSVAALPAFSAVMATSFETVLMTGEFAPESFGGVLLSGNAFNFLGVAPVVGRTIQPSDIRPDGDVEPVVVLSHKLWLRLFEGGPLGDRAHAAAERPSAHDRRRDAAAVWLVRQRRLLAADVADSNRPAGGESDHAAGARCVEQGGRGAAGRAHQTAGAGEARGAIRRRASRPGWSTTSTSPSRAARCRTASGCCSARWRSCC